MRSITNKRLVEREFNIHWLRSTLSVALNRLGSYEFKGPVAFAIHKNCQSVDRVIQSFFKWSNTLMRSYTMADSNGGILMKRLEDGQEVPVFRSENDEKLYRQFHHQALHNRPVKVELYAVTMAELEAALAGEDVEIAPNVLNAIQPMISDTEQELIEDLFGENVASPDQTKSDAVDRNDDQAPDDGDLPQPEEESDSGTDQPAAALSNG